MLRVAGQISTRLGMALYDSYSIKTKATDLSPSLVRVGSGGRGNA